MRPILLASVLVLALVLQLPMVTSTQPGTIDPGAPADSPVTRGPIRIDGNGGFLAGNGVVGGNGSPSNPYVISGWRIEAPNQGTAIYVGNATVHFIVRGNFLNNSSGASSYPYNNSNGVALVNDTHGTVSDNVLQANRGEDMLAFRSPSALITRNQVAATGVGGGGLRLFASSGSNVSNNAFTGPGYYSVKYEHTNSSMFWNNTVKGSNLDYAVEMWNSHWNAVASNNVSNNGKAGLRIQDSENNTLQGNAFWFNNGGGAYGWNAHNTTTSGNVVRKGGGTGIYFGSSRDLTVTNNTVVENAITGIQVQLSENPDQTLIAGNVAKGHGDYGFYLWTAAAQPSSARVIANVAVGNGKGGMYITPGRNADISDNNASSNTGFGFNIRSYGGWSSISRNSAFGNSAQGFVVEVDNSTIENNTARGNVAKDMEFADSWGNSIRRNRLYEWMFLRYHSNNNTVTDNLVAGDPAGTGAGRGIDLQESNGNLLESNRIYYAETGIYQFGGNHNRIMNNTIVARISPGFDAGIMIVGPWYDKASNETISGNRVLGGFDRGIYLDGGSADNVVAENVINGSDMALGSQFSARVAFERNSVNGSWTGIKLHSIDGCLVDNNSLSLPAASFGIDTSFTVRCRIASNDITGGGSGLRIDQGSDNLVELNTFSGMQGGAWANGVELKQSYRNTLRRNTITGNELNGVYVWRESAWNTIDRNNISGNGKDGVLVAGISNNNTLSLNQIWINGWAGVNMTGPSGFRPSNRVHHNDFQDNRGSMGQGYDGLGSNWWNDSTGGNHWSDFDEPAEGCSDSNSDGFCDTPRPIPGGKGAVDALPLTTPAISENLDRQGPMLLLVSFGLALLVRQVGSRRRHG